MFSDQENSRTCFSKQVNSLKKNFFSLLQENLTWIKSIPQNKTNFLDTKKLSFPQKYLFQENCYYPETIFLN